MFCKRFLAGEEEMDMAQRLLIGTRKGLFILERAEGSWRVAEHAFRGDPVTMALHDPRDGTLYAALNLGHFGIKLHRSGDGGGTWEELAAPAYPAQEEASEDAPSVDLIWSLEAAGADTPGVLWAGTIPGGLFRSHDRGESWTLNQPLWDREDRSRWFGGGYDDPGIHSIAIDPRDGRRIIVAVSCGGVLRTEDGGDSWATCTQGLWAYYVPPEQRDSPEIQDPHRMVRCSANPQALWIQHHNGVFRSTDDAGSWQEILDLPVSNFGFAVAVHPSDPDTAWLVPAEKDERRMPVADQVAVLRTRDGGRSFQVLTDGLPPAPAYDLIYRHGLDVDASGEALAMGSTTGGLWTSADGGTRWQLFSAHLPPIYCVRFG
jgi:photosystem II stability/assembly factor-like uncharacterized protein